MGSCVSRSPVSATVESGKVITAKVMDFDGTMELFAAPVTAQGALGTARRASCFVCNSDELYFDEPVRALGAHDELQAGQLYFVLPLSMLHRPLSGQDMAALAVKASAALQAATAAVGVDRTAGATSSQGKNWDGAAGKRRQTARVAPLVVVASGSEPDGEWNYHVYGRYDTHKTVYGDQTVGKSRRGVSYRDGRNRAGVQSLSAIVEDSE